MSLTTGIGSVITFYSWKGGVGRTLALANTAVQLARAGRKVLMVDWDLEAPGLHQYFLPPGPREAEHLTITPAKTPGGLWALLRTASRRGDGDLDENEWKSATARIGVPPLEPSASKPYVPTQGVLDLLAAGHDQEDYSAELGDFSWKSFFHDAKGGEWLEAVRRQWIKNYDFVFIDSRTGLTDSGGICTIQLPDTLVLVFAANDQSFGGGMKVIGAAQKARRNYGHDRGQLTVIPLLSRWAGDEETDIAEEWMKRFDRALPPVTDPWLPRGIAPRKFLERVRVPHVARFSFGEPLPVLTHSITDPALPGLAFDNLARLIASGMADAATIVDPAYDPPAPRTAGDQATATGAFATPLDITDIQLDLGKIARISGPDSEELLDALDAAGTALFRAAKYADSEPLLRRALTIDERRLGANHSRIAIRLNNLARLLQDTNRLAEAEPLMRRALAIHESSFGPEHPNVAISLNNLAQLLQATKRLAEAEPLMRRALAIDETSFGSDHPKVAIRLNNLAQLLQATNRLAEAEPLMRRALAIDEASLGPDHPNVAINLNNLAGLLQDTNRLAEAEPLMRRALAIDETSLGPDHPDVATSLNNLATMIEAQGQTAEAEVLYRRALAIDEASFGPDHPNVANSLLNLAGTLLNTGRATAAEPMIRRALGIYLAFEHATGHAHPSRENAIARFRAIFAALGRDTSETESALAAARRDAGLP